MLINFMSSALTLTRTGPSRTRTTLTRSKKRTKIYN